MPPGRGEVPPRIPGGARLHHPPSLWRAGARNGKSTGTPGLQGPEIPHLQSVEVVRSSGFRGRKPPGKAVSIPGQPNSSNPLSPFGLGGPSDLCRLASDRRTVGALRSPGKGEKKRRGSVPRWSHPKKRLGTRRSPSGTTRKERQPVPEITRGTGTSGGGGVELQAKALGS